MLKKNILVLCLLCTFNIIPICSNSFWKNSFLREQFYTDVKILAKTCSYVGAVIFLFSLHKLVDMNLNTASLDNKKNKEDIEKEYRRKKYYWTGLICGAALGASSYSLVFCGKELLYNCLYRSTLSEDK